MKHNSTFMKLVCSVFHATPCMKSQNYPYYQKCHLPFIGDLSLTLQRSPWKSRSKVNLCELFVPLTEGYKNHVFFFFLHTVG